MSSIKAKFNKNKGCNSFYVYFGFGQLLVVPVFGATKKKAMKELKAKLHEMVDEL